MVDTHFVAPHSSADGAIAKRLQIEQLNADPANPVTGQLYLNSTDDTLRIYDGAAWRVLADTIALALKANASNARLTGTPTATTFAAGDASGKLATTQFVQNVFNGLTSADIADINNVIDARVAALIDNAAGSREALNTLTELINAIEANMNTIDNIARKFVVTVGDGVATDFTITHNLNTRAVTVAVIESAAPFDSVIAGWRATTVNELTMTFAQPPALAFYTVIVTG